MARSMWAAAALVLALGGCGKSGDTAAADGAAAGGNKAVTVGAGEAGPAPGAAPSAQMRLNPGQWETKVEMAMVGVPANVASMMKGMTVTTKTCITPEEAGQPNGEIFSGNKGKGCTYTDFKAEGGHVRGTMTCSGNGEGTGTMAMDGQFGGDTFDVRMKVEGAAAGKTGGMEMHTVGRRIGDCSGGGQSG